MNLLLLLSVPRQAQHLLGSGESVRANASNPYLFDALLQCETGTPDVDDYHQGRLHEVTSVFGAKTWICFGPKLGTKRETYYKKGTMQKGHSFTFVM